MGEKLVHMSGCRALSNMSSRLMHEKNKLFKISGRPPPPPPPVAVYANVVHQWPDLPPQSNSLDKALGSWPAVMTLFGSLYLWNRKPAPCWASGFSTACWGGGGGRLKAPPMISAPGRRREKRKAAFEISRKIISKSFQSFLGSGQNWGHQGSKFQYFPKRFLDNKIFNYKGRAANLKPSCLSR